MTRLTNTNIITRGFSNALIYEFLGVFRLHRDSPLEGGRGVLRDLPNDVDTPLPPLKGGILQRGILCS